MDIQRNLYEHTNNQSQLPTIPCAPLRKPRGAPKPAGERKAANAAPSFQKPEWLGKTPPLVQKLFAKASQEHLPPEFWDHIIVLNVHRGRRRIRTTKARRSAIQTIAPALFASMNLTTLDCLTWLGKLAIDTGLTEARVSRALDDLEQAGLISKQLLRGFGKRYLPMKISVKFPLLQVFGVEEKLFANIQQQHQRYSKPENQVSQTIRANRKTANKPLYGFDLAYQRFKRGWKSVSDIVVAIVNKFNTHTAIWVDALLRRHKIGCYSVTLSTA